MRLAKSYSELLPARRFSQYPMIERPMPLLPLRYWFQFRLSTWFVMVAILTWHMSVKRPLYNDH